MSAIEFGAALFKPPFRKWVAPPTFLITALVIHSAAFANAGLPIRPGDYAVDGYTCADAPLAGLLHYERGNFSGPHESDCISVVRQKTGNIFKIATACRAHGDGTSVPSLTIVERYKVLSNERFAKLSTKPGLAEIAYQHCPSPAR